MVGARARVDAREGFAMEGLSNLSCVFADRYGKVSRSYLPMRVLLVLAGLLLLFAK